MKRVIKFINDLDKKGLYKIADKIDNTIKMSAVYPGYKDLGPDVNTGGSWQQDLKTGKYWYQDPQTKKWVFYSQLPTQKYNPANDTELQSQIAQDKQTAKNIAIGTAALGTAGLTGGYALGIREDRLYNQFKDLVNKMNAAQAAGKQQEAIALGQKAQQIYNDLNKTLRIYPRNREIKQIRDVAKNLAPEINTLRSNLGEEVVQSIKKPKNWWNFFRKVV